jgi:2-C-methyl-D-erythritol 4-phosphate cytidylyltransferase
LAQQEYALIVAGGKGARFGSSLPKQFLELNGKPVLLHTLDAFYRYSENIRVVLVLPEKEISRWEAVAEKHHFQKDLIIQSGGPTRFHSVNRGLEKIRGEGLVAIHDGVRPLVTPGIIATSFKLAAAHGCAVAAVPVKESIRVVDDRPGETFPYRKTRSVDRAFYKNIQTPQTFDVAMIKEAYDLHGDPSATDDAAIAERAGLSIVLFEGSYANIKITTAEDLLIAAAIQVHHPGL